MMGKRDEKIAVFWFRRDLRLTDNRGLHEALKSSLPVLPLFIFDTEILDELPPDDARVSFIYNSLSRLNQELKGHGSGILCLKGTAEAVWKDLINGYDIKAVFANEDYEPYAIRRDSLIGGHLSRNGIPFHLFKDQVIFSGNEILKNDRTPYTVFTPYRNRWLERFSSLDAVDYAVDRWDGYLKVRSEFPALGDLGFVPSPIKVPAFRLEGLDDYAETRDIPGLDRTSRLGPHLRFGTVGIRKVVAGSRSNAVFLSELIWREFFMQILFHFPQVVDQNFRSKYDGIRWRNNEEEFDKWTRGETGYPLVDAGMRQLNATGFMHNRVRMVTASFLCKHLLVDWRWGEAYFAEKLLDYELSSNNGNWQWAAGTGCDAAPYFRVFNPVEQARKFDPDLVYVKEWVPGYGTDAYPPAMVEHRFARERALRAYRLGMHSG